MKIQCENSGNQTVILELIRHPLSSQVHSTGLPWWSGLPRGLMKKHEPRKHRTLRSRTIDSDGGGYHRFPRSRECGATVRRASHRIHRRRRLARLRRCVLVHCITLIFPRQPVGSESTRRCGAPTRAANQTALTRYPSRTKHAGADVFSTFKGATQISDSVASAPVDRHSLGGKVHISFCQS